MKKVLFWFIFACLVLAWFSSVNAAGTGVFDPKTCASKVYNDGCNTCTINSSWESACTKMACFAAGTPYCIEASTWTVVSVFDPKTCISKSYNDGCNTCHFVSGDVAACTMMFCQNPGKPYCIEPVAISGSADTGVVIMVGNDKDEHGCIWSAGYTWSEVLNECIRPRELYSIKLEELPNIWISNINAKLQEFEDEQKNAFVKESEDTINGMWTGSECKPEFDLWWEIINNKDNILSIIATKYIYLCGAHGNTITTTFNFNKKSWNLIKLPQLFKDFGKSLKTISNNVYYGLVKTMWVKDKDAKQWIKDWTSVQEHNFANYTFGTKNGKINSITFYFDQYQVASYAEGQKQATISFPSLKFVK